MKFRHALCPALAAAALSACASMSAGPTATATLKPTQGNAVEGSVRFAQKDGRVLVTAEVSGLKPNSEHGFHVHDKGDCSAPDGMSAGGHFNPAARPHAHHGQSERHAGDMPNLKSDANGKATFSFATDLLSVGSGAANVVGRSIVVHRDPDDFKTQPTGNSGPRLACGVIAASN